MSDKTGIQWTDATWNPTTGCDRISPGCARCYAKTLHDRRHKAFLNGWTAAPAQYHQPFEVVTLHPDRLMDPLRWKEPRDIFVDSVSDLFHRDVPDQFIVDVFGVMFLAHWHRFQVLTKRADRMQAFMSNGDHGIVAQMTAMMGGGISTKQVFRALDIKRRDGVPLTWPPPNVWLGVSVENQPFADERIRLLLQTPAAVRFISAEPLLGAIDISKFLTAGDSANPNGALNTHGQTGSEANSADTLGPASRKAVAKNVGAIRQEAERPAVRKLDWVIVGGESGSGARPFDLAWARSILAQCQAAGVPVFVKQLGANVTTTWQTDMPFRDKKAGDPAEWPDDLRVRQFPEVHREP